MSLGGGGGGVSISSGERDSANLAMEQWEDYKARFKPTEKVMVDHAMSKDFRGDVERGEVTSGIQQSLDAGAEIELGRTFQAGADPTSGRGIGKLSDNSQKSGRARGVGLASESLRKRGAERDLKINAISTGRGIQTQALRDTGTVAQIQNSVSIATANADANDARMLGEGVGTAVGMGIGAYGAGV